MNYIKYLQFWFYGILKKEKIITDTSKSVFDINFNELKKKTNLVIFDFDDTLVDFGGKLNLKTINFLKSLTNKGFKVSVFSNCTKKRLEELNNVLEKINVYNKSGSSKPAPDGFLEIMSHFNMKPENTIAVGDKIGTEMYGAYLAGIKYRILVEPFSIIFGGKKASIFHRIVRSFEKYFYFIDKPFRTRVK